MSAQGTPRTHSLPITCTPFLGPLPAGCPALHPVPRSSPSHQLQEFSGKQQQLELQYRPVVQQLPTLLQQLQPEELSQAAEFAALEGLRSPILQVWRVCMYMWVSLMYGKLPRGHSAHLGRHCKKQEATLCVWRRGGAQGGLPAWCCCLPW